MTTKSLSVPVPADFNERLSGVIRAAMEHHGWRFTADGHGFTSEEMAAPDGMLSMWLHRAQEWMCQTISPLPAPMAYQHNGNSLCAAIPSPDRPSASLAVWALHIHFAMDEWRSRFPELVQQNKPIPIDELYNNWKQLLMTQSIRLKYPEPVPGILPDMGGPGPYMPQVAGPGSLSE